MKRIVYLLLSGSILLSACTDTIEGLDISELITTSTDRIEMDCIGGKTTIEIESYCDWTISSNEGWEWITVSRKSGERGLSQLEFTLDENDASTERTATITISNSRYSAKSEISVSQGEKGGYISIEETDLSFKADGETKRIDVKSNIAWKASCDADWLTISPTTNSNSNNTTLGITATSNPDARNRKATIKLSGKYKDDTIVKEINVNQKNSGTYISIDKQEFNALAEGSTHKVNIKSNVTWTASCNAQWANISPKSGNEGSTTLTITVAENTSKEDRTAEIVINNSEFDISEKIVIKQKPPYITLDKSTIDFAGIEEETQYLSIESNIEWVATCDANWITINPSYGNIDNNQIEIKAQANTSGQTRTTTIVVKDKDNKYNIVHKIAVKQEAGEAYVEFYDTGDIISAPSVQAEGTFTIYANCKWELWSSHDWVTLTPTSGEGNSSFTINVAANPYSEPREAKVMVGNASLNVYDEFTIEQSAWYGFTYTTTTGAALENIVYEGWGANAIAHTYGRVTFDGPITVVPEDAFSSLFSKLSSIELPESIVKIGKNAFYWNEQLTSIKIPENVTWIGAYAFYDTGLTSIEIPENVTWIDFSAFSTYNLSTVYVRSQVPPRLGSSYDTDYNTWTFTFATGWDNVYAYVWDAGNNNKEYLGSWPGTPMTLQGGGTWEFSLTTTDEFVEPMVVFNNGKGQQTSDLPLIRNVRYNENSTYNNPYCSIFKPYADTPNIYVPRNSVNSYKNSPYWSIYKDYIKGYDF